MNPANGSKSMCRRVLATSAIAIVILVALLGPACQQKSSPGPTPTPPPHTVEPQILKDITLGGAYALIQSNQGNPNFIIMDIRTAEEYANGYIET